EIHCPLQTLTAPVRHPKTRVSGTGNPLDCSCLDRSLTGPAAGQAVSGGTRIMMTSPIRTLAAAIVAVGALSGAALADSGTIRFSVFKAAFFVGGSGGDGTLTFKGRNYPISIAGVSGGLA